MISGTYNVNRVEEYTVCRSSLKYQFVEIGLYKIHSISLMPRITFGKAKNVNKKVDKTIFVNDEETKLYNVQTKIETQNYLTTRFVGRAPLYHYNKGEFTELGHQFILRCRDGNPNEIYRSFGTEAAIAGYNKSANDNDYLPEGEDGSK